MNSRVQTQDVEGLVEAVNATGLKLGGAWLNVSQFHPVDLPEVGAHVRLKIDSKGYIRELVTVGEVPASPAVLSDKDERITRLAVLKAAAGFAANKDIKSSEVLMIADKWLEWVERD